MVVCDAMRCDVLRYGALHSNGLRSQRCNIIVIIVIVIAIEVWSSRESLSPLLFHSVTTTLDDAGSCCSH